jgi:hypothetical protein
MLLGYYLAVSHFRAVIWIDFLQRTLPPINDSLLPTFYVGFIGAIFGLFFAYILFNWLVEKKYWRTNKKNYIAAACLLVLALSLVVGIFRLHAVATVTNAQKTSPAEIRINFIGAGGSIIFETGPDSTSEIGKWVTVGTICLGQMGRALQDMERLDVLGRGCPPPPAGQTMAVFYRPKGKFYTRMIACGEGIFSERVTGNRIVLYRSEALERLLAQLSASAGKLEQFNQARLINSENILDPEKQPVLSGEVLRQLFGQIHEDSAITPDAGMVERFLDLEQNGVRQGDTGIYVLQLDTGSSPTGQYQNFMVYDSLIEILKYEDKYYRVNLNGIIP